MRVRLAEHRCPGCEIFKTHCFCAEFPKIALATRVVVLMHTAEEVLTSNTARPTVKALTNSELRIRGRKGDVLSAAGLREPDRTALLLYPSSHAAELTAEFAAGLTQPVTLIVPDGSWTQTRKFVRRSPVLAGLTHVKLLPGPPSEYRLRAQSQAEGLCTLEAVARAIGVLESPAAQAQLEALLRVMVDRTLQSRGARRQRRTATLNPTSHTTEA